MGVEAPDWGAATSTAGIATDSGVEAVWVDSDVAQHPGAQG
ncbi:MAG: hypothetical protein R3E12_13460 [Candidatus Eisenbacteria bacterium]